MRRDGSVGVRGSKEKKVKSGYLTSNFPFIDLKNQLSGWLEPRKRTQFQRTLNFIHTLDDNKTHFIPSPSFLRPFGSKGVRPEANTLRGQGLALSLIRAGTSPAQTLPGAHA